MLSIGNNLIRRGMPYALFMLRGLVVLYAVMLLPRVFADQQDRVEHSGGDSVYRIELSDEKTLSGRVESIDAQELVLRSNEELCRVPIATVRSITQMPLSDEKFWPIELTLVEGSTLCGDQVSLSGNTVSLSRSGTTIDLPSTSVFLVHFHSSQENKMAVDDWRSELPEKPDGDSVFVKRENGFEIVSCAILEISDDSVTILLDEEKIPVKRSKIAGLAWLRPTDDSSPIAGSVLVTLAGGRLLAKAVHVENDTVQIDLTAIDPIHLTLSDIRSLDFTAGRVVSLVSLKPEKVEVEPFFGSLFLIEGFSEYFRPRSVGSAASIDGTATIESLFIQPRTTMTWRIPPDSLLLRTRAQLSKDVGQGSALMRILLDDKELMRQVFASGVGATSDQHTNSQNASVTDLDIRLSVQGARKLQIVVDYGPNGDAGGTIRLEKPRIEK